MTKPTADADSPPAAPRRYRTHLARLRRLAKDHGQPVSEAMAHGMRDGLRSDAEPLSEDRAYMEDYWPW